MYSADYKTGDGSTQHGARCPCVNADDQDRFTATEKPFILQTFLWSPVGSACTLISCKAQGTENSSEAINA